MEAVLTFLEALSAIPASAWIKQIYLGLVNGSVFILLALGLSIIFGMMGIPNFGHGAFYMLGAYAGWVFFKHTGNFWLSLAIAPVVIGSLGIAAEVALLRQTYEKKESVFLGVLVTFGILLFAPDFIRMVFGKEGLPFAVPEALRGTAFTFENTDFSRYRVFLICVTFALAVFLWLLLNRTKLGMLIRAGTSDPLMVEVLGVDIRKIWSISFGLGISLAAFAGVMVGPIFAVQPTMGEVVLIQSFIVVIVGGMGSFWGAVISGIIVGQVLTVFPLIPYLEPAADVLIYLLMVTVLVLRPRGLFGEEGIFTE